MLAQIPVHITHRGNNRQACFYEDNDRAFYLFHLRRLLPNTQCSLHAYCLMSNHVHLLLTPASVESCAALMKALAQLHTQYVNRTYGRSGSLWEGRFHSCLVQSDQYLLTCYRYVERNPVEAGLCKRPEEYEWSSCRANANGLVDAAIAPHEQYILLGMTAESRRAAYRELVSTRIPPEKVDEIRSATSGNFALGDDQFKQVISTALGRRAYPGTPGRRRQSVSREEDQGELFA